MERAPTGLARTLLASFFIALIAVGSIWVLAPFLPALIWATMIVVATWPLLLSLQKRLGGSRKLAMLGMVIVMAALVIVPLGLAVYMLLSHADQAMELLKKLPEMTLPPPPEWVAKVPLIGQKFAADWNHMVSEGPGALATYLKPYARDIASGVIRATEGAGLFFVHLLLTLLLSAILYNSGEKAARTVILFARRVADDRGESSVILAGQSIKAVAMGIVITALVQTILGGFGLWVAGVPFTGLITAAMFIFCIAQLGPMIPLLIGVTWLYTHGHNTSGTALLIWTLAVGLLDNFLRPVLIRKGADLPLLLILAGVLGGLMTLGIVGLFIGPMILAVTSRLLDAWIHEQPSASPEAPPPPLYSNPQNPVPQDFLDH